MNDIEKYLADEMTAEERSAFETGLKNNPALAREVASLRQLTTDIETAALSERVAEALAGLPNPVQSNPARRWWWLLPLSGLVILLCWYWFSRIEPPASPVPPPFEQVPNHQPQTDPSSTGPDRESPPQNIQEKNPPIAGTRLVPAETPAPAIAPRLRGSWPAADSSRQTLLNAVWYTEYPPKYLQLTKDFQLVDELLQQRDFSRSYARLQLMERKSPANDTIFFLKAYCLLEQGEGGEALRYFDQIENLKIAWADEIDWYKGLSYLLAGDYGQAKKVFSDISENPGHRFRKEAKRALDALK